MAIDVSHPAGTVVTIEAQYAHSYGLSVKIATRGHSYSPGDAAVGNNGPATTALKGQLYPTGRN